MMSNEELTILTLAALVLFLYIINRCGPTPTPYHSREVEC